MRMLHAKLLRPLIHLLDKCRLRACQMLCHRHCGIITRSNFDAFDHILHRLFLTCLEETLRATHRRRMLSHDNRIVQCDIATPQRLEDQKQRHDLCYRCRSQHLIRILLVEYRPTLQLHQKHRFRLDCKRIIFACRCGCFHNRLRISFCRLIDRCVSPHCHKTPKHQCQGHNCQYYFLHFHSFYNFRPPLICTLYETTLQKMNIIRKSVKEHLYVWHCGLL